MNQIITVNPATDEPIAEYDIMDKTQTDETVKRAKRAFPEWRRSYASRQGYIYNLAEYLTKHKYELAKVATAEMGKTMKESVGEVEKCAKTMIYYADHGDSFLADEVLNTDARKSFLAFEPLGVVGSIMPWNFPYWQALRFAAPCLMAGNVIVMKPSRVTLQSGLEVMKAFAEAGIPDGVLQTLTGSVDTATHLIDSDVAAITFTGSTQAGAKVGRRATGQLKKCVLELGGSDPFIVLDDAIIEDAAEGAVKGRFINCGQSCVASKRFILGKNIAGEFIEQFVKNTSRLTVGDPTSMDTDIGPLSTKGGLETISEMVEDARAKGANVLVGGKQIGNRGCFYEPTIITDIKDDMLLHTEETFGPIAPIAIIDDERDAIKMANATEFGLGASIWTRDLAKAERLSRRIESGIVSVNNVVVSDPRIPFGGIKNSGFGRELSKHGMMEFVNIKSVRFYDNLIHHHYVE
ncbi:MAG: NAD-dependent succinate-semialdehyde dehydrogenase [Cenarchaeum sp. SB0663_bin_5]|nr:NAD-dependent succinate-semialdehyde dehydrogenase [Cenarchaeum sp. SB0663_bin_5]MYH03357.1 NAD-dependent succinate-semialdehyde dehydrogenase [Cenarchaeum sp. SB0675_bin_21]MYL10890.1 NAD-dependent succinate-semialdehyde dehydrogenase [Cenarchaeum sp. SB0669_bin_11]